MICPNCNSQLPDGGFFCPECGMRIPQTAAAVAAAAVIEQPTVVAPAAPVQQEIPVYRETPVYPEPSVYPKAPVYPEAPASAVVIPPVAEVSVSAEKPKKEKKVKEKKVKEKKPSSGKKAGGVVLTVLLVVLLVAALALNVWQYMSNAKTVEELQGKVDSSEKTLEENAKTIKELQATTSADKKTIADLKEQLSSGSSAAEDLNEKIDQLTKDLTASQNDVSKRDVVIEEQAALIKALEPYAANYETIINELLGQKIGFAANNFCANRSAIVLSMSEKYKQFYLTANWPEGGTVYMDTTGTAARLEYGADSWDSGVTMTVHAQAPGVCIVTFSNSVDDSVFKVLVIVTE